MLADLWHAPKARTDKKEEQPLGTSTIGSSEACMLGGLALKRSWREARKAAGKPTDKPNLVLGINAQVRSTFLYSAWHYAEWNVWRKMLLRSVQSEHGGDSPGVCSLRAGVLGEVL